MFFVGATGQLVTLILTVCLPFVFLISGNHKVDIQSPANYLFISQAKEEITFAKDVSFHHQSEVKTEEFRVQSDFCDIPATTDSLLPEYCNRWKSVYSKSSGNKAPPRSVYFSC